MAADTILVVDDDQQLGRFIVEVLGHAGFPAEVCTLGRAALERLSENPERFEAVVLDRRMPDIDGLSVLRRLKGNGATRDIPVVLLTGLTSEQDVIDGIDAGAYYYVTKPFRESVLQAVVRAATDDFRARMGLREELASAGHAVGLMRHGEFQFRTPQQARVLAGLLAHCGQPPSALVTGLWELLVNAIEHGNLGIGYQEKSELLAEGRWHREVDRRLLSPEHLDKFGTVSVETTPRHVIYTITDCGQGFDPRPYFDFEPGRATHVHGRGIAMARRLSFTSLEYLGNGNTVRATGERATTRI